MQLALLSVSSLTFEIPDFFVKVCKTWVLQDLHQEEAEAVVAVADAVASVAVGEVAEPPVDVVALVDVGVEEEPQEAGELPVVDVEVVVVVLERLLSSLTDMKACLLLVAKKMLLLRITWFLAKAFMERSVCLLKMPKRARLSTVCGILSVQSWLQPSSVAWIRFTWPLAAKFYILVQPLEPVSLTCLMLLVPKAWCMPWNSRIDLAGI